MPDEHLQTPLTPSQAADSVYQPGKLLQAARNKEFFVTRLHNVRASMIHFIDVLNGSKYNMAHSSSPAAI